jgi:hypothetical protein
MSKRDAHLCCAKRCCAQPKSSWSQQAVQKGGRESRPAEALRMATHRCNTAPSSCEKGVEATEASCGVLTDTTSHRFCFVLRVETRQ